MSLAIHPLAGQSSGPEPATLESLGIGVLIRLAEYVPMPLLLLDRRGHVVVCNDAARAILKDENGLVLRADRRLQVGDGDDAARFRRLLRCSGYARLMAVARCDDHLPLTILTVPLCPDIPRGDDNTAPALAVFVTDPSVRPCPSRAALRHLYALTEAEARLAVAILERCDLTAAAKKLGITINTARTHLKRVFAKTDTRRQGELIRLLLCGPAALLSWLPPESPW